LVTEHTAVVTGYIMNVMGPHSRLHAQYIKYIAIYAHGEPILAADWGNEREGSGR